MYAGLLMLAVGTYLGVSLATDGARAGSPFLLAVGAAVFGAGVLCDLVLQSLWRGRRGECLLLLVPRRGAQVALVTGDEQASDRVLRAVAARAAAPRNLAPGSSIR
jgi:hypothetical protein